jgi:hypothetical protein
MWYYNTSGHIIFLQHTTDCEDDRRYFPVKCEVMHYCIFPSALKDTNHVSHSKSTQGKKRQEFTLTSIDFDEDMNPSGRISIYCHYHTYIHTYIHTKCPELSDTVLLNWYTWTSPTCLF